MKLLNLLKHRLVRIFQSYFPHPLSETEHELIATSLDRQLVALFYAQPLCDQRHGLLVYQKCLDLFNNTLDPPTNRELLIASCFHDVAKKDCRFNVTQRVIVATALSMLPVKSHVKMRTSKSKLLRRIGIYVDHAELSWDFLKKHTSSEFVREVTIFHHGSPQGLLSAPDQAKNLELFVIADTL